MPVSAAEAKAITREFTAAYPRALDLGFRLRSTSYGLYGTNADKVPSTMRGGYSPVPFVYHGRRLLGRVDINLNNAVDANDLRLTLRHEVIGHFGINTFSPDHKRALLESLIANQAQPSLQPYWAAIDRNYPGRSPEVKAEEVFCLRAEAVSPAHHINQSGVTEAGQRAFDATVRDRMRPMQAQDLDRIVRMVAHGLHDRSRAQQTFPTQEVGRHHPASPTPDAQHAALRAEALMIAERLARLDGPTASSPFTHPDLQAHYQDVQRQPAPGPSRATSHGR